MKDSRYVPPNLSFINWINEFINILNVPFSNSVAVKQLFRKQTEIVQHEATRLSKLHSTFDAKAIVIKMKFTVCQC